MNKEVIKNNREVFDYWLDGGEVLYRRIHSNKWINNSSSISWEDPDKIYIENDEYVEFRKALADGKDIQYYVDGFSGWQDTDNFNNPVKGCINYRIKPKEQLKVGDWCWYGYELAQVIAVNPIKVCRQQSDVYEEPRTNSLEPFIGNLPSFVKVINKKINKGIK